METSAASSILVLLSLFKSYYVVWKPTIDMLYELSEVRFKSYYVVWKLLYPWEN